MLRRGRELQGLPASGPMQVARRSLVVAMATLILSKPGEAEEDPGAITVAGQRFAQLFADLLKPFKEIGDNAERQRLIDGLLALNHDLYTLEQEKRYVIIALRRQPLNPAELRKSSNSLSQEIEVLRLSLRGLVPQLRVAYGKGADDAIASLNDAPSTRKGFVLNLLSVDQTTAEKSAGEAQKAVEALVTAQRALADAISALQKR